MPLATLIKTIQDIMRKDVGVDGDAQRISQICWLLFLKIFDDKEQEWELTNPRYKSPLQSRFRWSNWAKNPEGDTGQELVDFVNNDLFPALKRLATTAGVSPHGRVVGSVFEDAYNYMKSGTLLRQVINTIEEDVDFNSSTDRHLFNEIYEKILADLQSAGNAGEYYTPRAVTQFIVDILDPQLGETILDPACGTGGFLTCAIEHLKKSVRTPDDSQVMQKSIHGVEKKPLPHMLAMTNMMLHGIDVPANILHDNTLARPFKDYGPRDRVDIILTNPPFGGMEEDGIENNFLAKHKTRETADLFMALIMHLLRNNTGRAAVVLPDGFLFGEGVKTTLKRELLEEFNLHTIVRMPKGVFAPYTSINTNLIFFEKGEPTKDVWFFQHPYPEGYKSYSRSKPLSIEEFDLEKKWWGGANRRGRKTTPYAWKVSAKEIADSNYDLDRKNPHEVAFQHSDPDVLMEEYARVAGELERTQNELKAELMTALDAGGHETRMLERHFDTAFAAPDGIKRLRELILMLAVQGKLVPQNPDDAPASELLKEIEAARGKLVKERKIKEPKPLPLVTSSEIPFPMPQGWECVRFGAVVQIINGRAYKQNELLETGTPVLRVGNLFTSKHWYYSDLSLENDKYIDHGDLIYAWSASFGPFIWAGKRIIYHYHIWKIRFFHEIGPDKLYLYNYLLEATERIKISGSGIAMIHMTKERMEQLVLPIPPLKEQQRMVIKISQLMTLCDHISAQIDLRIKAHEALLNAVMARFMEPRCV